jgi:hypothetical protein
MTFDYLSIFETWLSTGYYPTETIYANMTVDRDPDTAGTQSGGQLPMPPYPGWVKYAGGDKLQGTSYVIDYTIPDGYDFD